jgi:hypothetical protein
MAIEKHFIAISARSFTSNGTSGGLVTLASTAGFKVKQLVLIKGTALTTLELQVKRVISSTQLLVGPKNSDLTTYSDISSYTTAASSTIESLEQPKPAIPLDSMDRAVYETEPTLALRIIPVDQYGNINSLSEESNLGVNAFALDTADTSMSVTDVSKYRAGSLEISWSGATSSDAFATPGYFTVLIGNTASPSTTEATIYVSAASGSYLYRGLDIDFKNIQISWTKANSTGGSATITTHFKAN